MTYFWRLISLDTLTKELASHGIHLARGRRRLNMKILGFRLSARNILSPTLIDFTYVVG